MAELKKYLNERGLREVWDIINGQNSLIVSKIKDIQKRATVGLYADSTSGWAENESKISEAGALYIYTDAETFNGKVIAKVKIGDGTSSLADLSFIDAPYSAHIADRDIHFTAEERAQWNDEISAFATAAEESANTATQAAERAETAKTAAETARDTAVSAKKRAMAAEANASQFEDRAEEYAHNAKGSELNAAESAERAEGARQGAYSNANIAGDYATKARDSANNADSAANRAQELVSQAGGQADRATVAANRSETAAQTAQTAADSATADKQAVQTLAEQVTADKATVADHAAQVAEDRTAAENAAQTTQSIADSLPADINTKVETNKQDISFIKLNYVSKQKLNTCLDKNAFKATYSTFIDSKSPGFESTKSMFIDAINSGGFTWDERIGLGSGFELREVIENVPCIIDHKESTKTIEYDIYFRCVAVDFFKPKNWSHKGSFTFMPTEPIGTNIIDNATGLGDIHAYSQTFIQQKVMPVYAAHFKSLFGENLAEFSDPLPHEIRKDVGSYAYSDRGGRSVENYGNEDEYTSYSLRLPSEPEIFGHYITSGCNDNSGMESQLPYFINNPITAWDWSLIDNDKGMWLSSYSGANYYGYYDPKRRTIGSRPAIVEFGIYPLLTLVRK